MSAIRICSLFAKITLICVYLVILAGSVVRMSGSGMGCPDWPKCFGQWIPPTDISELPEYYEEAFLEKRTEKLDKYIRLVEGIGMPDVAESMRNDPSLLESEPFDARGTWIEYINRLFGFLSGNALLVLFIASLFLIKSKPIVTMMSFISLIAIGFQAWLGSVVVATNLLPWTITIHMIVAFLIIGLLIMIMRMVSEEKGKLNFNLRSLLILAMVLTLVQVVLGTQVRQEIDEIARSFANRSEWITQLTETFHFHRSFSILILAVNGWFVWSNRSYLKNTYVKALIAILILEILVGIVLSYFAMPALAQPTHLLLATILFGIQVYLWEFSSKVKLTS